MRGRWRRSGRPVALWVAVWAWAWAAVPAVASGQAGAERDPVTLEAAVRAALVSQPSLEAARARVDAAEAGVGEARAAWLPTVATQAHATRYQEPMVVAPLHGFDLMSPPTFERTLVQAHAVAEWLAFDGGARGARIEGARGLAASAAAGLAAEEEAVMVEAVSSYVAASSAESLVAAHDEAVRALETERGRAALLLEQGKTPRVAVLRSEAALSRARAERAAAVEARLLALRRLARVTGLPVERLEALERVRPEAGEAVADRDALMATALSAHPELARSRGRAAAATSMVAAARSAYLPRLGVAARYSAYGSAEMSPDPEWSAGVQVSWPLFTGGARARAVERAAAEARAAEGEAAVVARRVADAVDGALAAYRTARARTEALEAAVAQWEEVARIEALALEAGAGVQTDYLRAEADLLQARAALTEARAAVVEARVRLAAATGTLTMAWLSEWTGEEEP